MSDVTTDTNLHAYGADVERECAARKVEGHQLGEISDGVALAIASWYAAPRGAGLVMAQLATTGTIEVEVLLDAIHWERQNTAMGDADQEWALDLLATWALNHPSRTDV